MLKLKLSSPLSLPDMSNSIYGGAAGLTSLIGYPPFVWSPLFLNYPAALCRTEPTSPELKSRDIENRYTPEHDPSGGKNDILIKTLALNLRIVH